VIDLRIVLRGYDPDQERDDHGKWTAGAYGEGGKYEDRAARITKAPKISSKVFGKLSVKTIEKEFSTPEKPPNGYEMTIKTTDDLEDWRHDTNESGLRIGDKIWEDHNGDYHIERKYPYTRANSIIEAVADHSEDTSIGSYSRKLMDELYERMGVTLTKDAVVYRGLDLSDSKLRQIAKAAQGRSHVYVTHSSKRFVPTSASKSEAGGFGNTRVRIMLPKGSRVLPIGKMNGYGEKEVTLDRGAKLRIVGATGYNRFDAELVSSVHQKKSALKLLLASLLRQVLDEEDDTLDESWKPSKARTAEERAKRFGGDVAAVEIDGEVVFEDETVEEEPTEKLLRAFDPDQPRDDSGRWGEGGSGAKGGGSSGDRIPDSELPPPDIAVMSYVAGGFLEEGGLDTTRGLMIRSFKKFPEEAQEMKQAARKALDRISPDSDTVELYHYSSGPWSEFRDRGGFGEFRSFTYSKDAALRLLNDAGSGKGWMYTIHAPKSSIGVVVDYSDVNIQEHAWQKEVLNDKFIPVSAIHRAKQYRSKKQRATLAESVIDLRKTFTAPTSATSGLASYDLDGQRRTLVRLRPKRQRLMERGGTGRVKLIPINGGRS